MPRGSYISGESIVLSCEFGWGSATDGCLCVRVKGRLGKKVAQGNLGELVEHEKG